MLPIYGRRCLALRRGDCLEQASPGQLPRRASIRGWPSGIDTTPCAGLLAEDAVADFARLLLRSSRAMMKIFSPGGRRAMMALFRYKALSARTYDILAIFRRAVGRRSDGLLFSSLAFKMHALAADIALRRRFITPIRCHGLLIVSNDARDGSASLSRWLPRNHRFVSHSHCP